MNLSLKIRLHNYLVKQQGWVSSGDLQRLVMEKTSYLPRTTVRRLEELKEEGLLEVEYRNKHHAFYRAKNASWGTVARQEGTSSFDLQATIKAMSAYWESLLVK